MISNWDLLACFFVKRHQIASCHTQQKAFIFYKTVLKFFSPRYSAKFLNASLVRKSFENVLKPHLQNNFYVLRSFVATIMYWRKLLSNNLIIFLETEFILHGFWVNHHHYHRHRKQRVIIFVECFVTNFDEHAIFETSEQ